MEASHSGRHKGGRSGYEASQKEESADAPKSKSDLSAAFLRAARSGNYEKVVEFLKESRVDIDACNVNGLNALHLAAKDGHVNIVIELLNYGVNVDSATKKGNTALHIASLAGQLDVVKTLIQYRARINVQSQAGFTPLYMAAQENHAEVVKYLLDKGANASLATEEGFTPLAVALQQEHSQVVAILTEASQKGRVKLSALHVAAKKDDVRAAIMLLENEQNQGDRSRASEIINEPTKSGFTPLHIAAHYGNQNVATVLIDHGADVDFKARNSITPLHVASKWGRKNITSLLLNNYATVDCKTRDGLTPLHCAARSGHDLVVNMLLESSAPVSVKTRNGLSALHMAAQGDHVDCARILISHKAAVDEVTVDYLTPLHVAAHCGNVATAKLLLDRNCEVNSRALNGFTPLHIACKKNRVKVIELLLQYGANIGSTTESGLTPLHVASFMGYMEIVQMLLSRGCDPNAPTVRGETPLHLATRGSQVEVMRLLLKNGAIVDATAKEDQTPLHTAARTGSTEAVILLLQHKANPNAATKELYTPLHIAAKEGHDEVIQVLLERGADPTLATSKGFSPLHIAAKYGNIDAAKTLMANGGDANCVGKNGLTPLHVATHYNQIEMVQLLLDKGSNPHAVAKNGYTPLHIAAKKNELEIATSLLEHRAKPNAESRNGFTPLHLAAQEGHTDMVALLLRAGAKSNIKAKNGLTPMHLAAQEDHVPVAEVLVRHDSEIDTQTKAGYTPLHTACHFGQLNMIRFLLENGASVQMTTKAGHTPLHQAAQQGHVLVINMLLRCRADPNALTANGQTPLSIAQCLGYISVVEILKETTTITVTEYDEKLKYKLMSPEIMQEAAMSDEDDDDEADEKHLADQSYQYLTTGDDFGGLREEPGGEVGMQGKDRDSFGFDQRSSLHSSLGFGPTQEDMRYTADDLDSQSGGSIRRHRADERAWVVGESREPSVRASSSQASPPVFKSTEDQVYFLENGAGVGGARDVGDFDAASAPLRKRSKLKATTHVEETVLTKRIFREEHGFTETHFDDEPVAAARRETGLGAEPPYSVLVIPKDQYDLRDVAQRDAMDSDSVQWRSAGSAQVAGGRNVVLPPRDQYDVADFMARDEPGADEVEWRQAGLAKSDAGRDVVVPGKDQYDVRNLTDRDAAGGVEEECWIGSGVVRPSPGQDVVVIREELVPDVDDEKDNVVDAEVLTPAVEEVVKEAEANKYMLAAPDFVRGHGGPLFKSNLSETDSRMFGSTYSGMSFASSLDPDNVALNRQPIYSGFLVSFLVDARGGAMRGCRHSGIRIIIPPGRACMPTRVTCKLVKKEKLPQPPPLMEGEALASRVLVMGPSGAKFLGPVILEVPHFASLRGAEREITVLRSENGQTWREHTDLATLDSIQNTLCGSFEDLESAEELYHRRITRIITSDFPKYFAVVTRIRQETSVVSQKGGIISSTVVPQVQTVFPPGAVTKSIKLGLQAQPITDELVEKVCGSKVSVSPIVTIEPRRRKFHQPITVTIPLPPNLQSVKQVERIPTMRLLCSMNAAMDPTEWEDITGSTPMTLTNNCVSFTTTVSARFWLVNSDKPKESIMNGSNLYAEAIVVPFMANFVVFAKRLGLLDAQLRLFCMTDDKMDKTLESQEKFSEVSRSRDVEVLDGKAQWVECTGNLLRVLKGDESDKQPKISFRAFRENRQSLNVRVRHFEEEPTGSLLFMREPRSTKEQTPICNLTVTLPSSSDGAVSSGSTVDTDELQQKLQLLKQLELPEEELISKAELRLTDIAEYLAYDWIPLARQLRLSEEDIAKIEKEYTYVVEQALVMLHTWIEREKDGASGNALERALRSIGRLDIIAKCIYAVEEVTDIKEKQAAKIYLDSGEPADGVNGDLDHDGHDQQNGYQEEPIDGVRKDYLLLSIETKTPPSTPADLDNMVPSPTVTESEVAASMAKKKNRKLHDEDDDVEPETIEPETIEPETIEPETIEQEVHQVKEIPAATVQATTIQEPTNQEPTNQDPANQAPTNHEPTNQDPANHESTNQEPANQDPTNHEPANQDPANHEPANQYPTNQVPTSATNGAIDTTGPKPVLEDTSFEDWVEHKQMSYSDPSRRERLMHENSKEVVACKQTIDGELDLKIEIDEDEGLLDDGTLVRRQVITRRHVYPVTEITTIDGVEADWKTSEKLVKIEVEEDILELPPGVDDSADQENLATRTSVAESDEVTEDGVPVHRKVTRTVIVPFVPGIESRAEQMVVHAFDEAFDEVKAAAAAMERVEPTETSDHDDDEADSAVLKVYTDMQEGIPEVETDVQEFEETLPDGSIVKRRVVKTKQKQTITKRVVVEGPEDELPANEEEAQEMMRRVEADEPIQSRMENRSRDTPETETSVQEYEETLSDGTVVKRRIITTTEQQLTTERVVLEGDDFEDDGDYDDGPADHIPYSERADDSGMQVTQAAEDDGEETATVMMKKEIRKKKILRDGKEETIITEDVHMVQDEEEPEELRDSVQMIIDQFMEGTSLDIDSSYGGQHK